MLGSTLFQPPYLGAAWYPEAWPREQVERDVELMKEAGLNVARIGEFAWARMEPAEHQYDFVWLHDAVSRLADSGIATILGTPSATPPAWLSARHPEILFVHPEGWTATHGGRRHVCPSSPVYRAHCRRIVRRMAEEFRGDSRIIGWQIDNEIYPHNGERSCACPSCVDGFRDFLRARFETIERLNELWCLQLWSQAYSDFDQIPAPRREVWHHPSLLAAWDEFTSHIHIDFVREQAEMLSEVMREKPAAREGDDLLAAAPRPRRHVGLRQWIGTDMMPFGLIDHREMNEHLDVVQFNHYHPVDSLPDAAFWFDRMRPFRPRPFWCTETAATWNGGTKAGWNLPPRGFCRANSWLPIALGAEANLYWLWRTHPAGQELMHGAVITTEGRPGPAFEEIQEISSGFYAAAEFLRATAPEPARVALHAGHQAWVTFHNQPMVAGFNYQDSLIRQIYMPLIEAQFRMDVIDPAVDLTPYRVVLSPFLPALDSGGLRERLTDWIHAGGTWIAGPFTDCRTVHGTKFTHAPFGSLEELGGVYLKLSIPGSGNHEILWRDGTLSPAQLWLDGFESRGAEILATHETDGVKGLAAITSHRLGKGRVIVLGCLPGALHLQRLVLNVAREADCSPEIDADPNLLVVPRRGEGVGGLIVVELRNKPGTVRLRRRKLDLITSRRWSGSLDVEPFGVHVLKWDE